MVATKAIGAQERIDICFWEEEHGEIAVASITKEHAELNVMWEDEAIL